MNERKSLDRGQNPERGNLLDDLPENSHVGDDDESNYELDVDSVGRIGQFRRSRIAAVCITALTLFVDMMMYGIVVPILPIIVHERLGRGSGSIGFLFGCYAIGLLSATPIFAVLSDRYKTRKIPMLIGMASLVICTLMFRAASTFWQLVTARIAQGVAGGASWTISLAMLADIFGSGESLGIAMGTVLSANTIGALMGPIIGGYLFEHLGYTAPFMFCAGLALTDFLVMLCIVEPEEVARWERAKRRRNGEISPEESLLEKEKPETPETPETPEKPPSMWTLINDWNVQSVCFGVTVTASVFAGIEPILPIYLRERFHIDPVTIGTIYIAVVLPTILSPVVGMLQNRIGPRLLSGIGMILLGVMGPMVAVPNSQWLVVLPLIGFGAAYTMVTTPTLPMVGEYITSKGGGAYGQVYAIWNMAYSIGMCLGPVLGGLLEEYYGFRWAMVFFGIAMLGAAPSMLYGNKSRTDQASNSEKS